MRVAIHNASVPAMLVIAAMLTAIAVPTVLAAHLFHGCDRGDPGEGLAPTPADSGAYVDVKHFSFKDRETQDSLTTISAGETVTWVWESEYCHSVTQVTLIDEIPGPAGPRNALNAVLFPDRFDSGGDLEEPDFENGKDSFSITFPAPGVYQYECRHHQGKGMTGTIIVTA